MYNRIPTATAVSTGKVLSDQDTGPTVGNWALSGNGTAHHWADCGTKDMHSPFPLMYLANLEQTNVSAV